MDVSLRTSSRTWTPLRPLHRLLVAVLVICAACHGESARRPVGSPAVTSKVANLHAFARQYGVLRWFHPSDAAAVLDWNRFATDGVRAVVGVEDVASLRRVLAGLIAPMSAGVHLVAQDERFPAGPAGPSSAGYETVSWEHLGYGDSVIASGYASKRRNRPRTVPVPGAPFGALWQGMDATQLRGKRIRLRGDVRTANGGLGRLWLRVDRGDKRGFFENMRERPVVSASWAPAEIIGTVEADATRVAFGIIKTGEGVSWYDNIKLDVEIADGTWKSLDVADGGFEADHLFAGWSPGTGAANASLEGWLATRDAVGPASGKTALRLETEMKVVKEELFADSPSPGETVDIDLGQGLRARIPISLYSVDGHTIGDDPAAARASQSTPAAQSVGFDRATGVADVIVLWNVLEHFWPYWDLVSVDWKSQLDVVLADALDDQTMDDHKATVRRLLAVPSDAHAEVSCPGATAQAGAPFEVAFVDGSVVVTAATDKRLQRGDEVVSVDGRPAVEQLLADAALVSGSRHWQLANALQGFGRGPAKALLSLRVRRGGAVLDFELTRGDVSPEAARRAIERLDGNIYYVDLSRASMAEINLVMAELANATGVVFDLRGYPSSNHEVLSHLTEREISMTKGMSIAHIIRPDHVPSAVLSWETSTESLPAVKPRISGAVAFLTGPMAFSYAESVMLLVEHYHLGEIVGEPTAGTTGNKAEIGTPTGCRVWFTGMRVTKQDGAQLHLIGVQPTITARRTRQGIVAGRDEVLEKALGYIRGTAKPQGRTTGGATP